MDLAVLTPSLAGLFGVLVGAGISSWTQRSTHKDRLAADRELAERKITADIALAERKLTAHGAGWSSEPSPGLAAAGDWRKISRRPSPAARHGFILLPFSCWHVVLPDPTTSHRCSYVARHNHYDS